MRNALTIDNNLRPGVRQAIDACKQAGINVRMVSGETESLETAKQIAIEAGILSSEEMSMEDQENGVYICMTGEQFRKTISGVVYTQGEDLSCEIMNLAAFRRIYRSLKVLT